jgi:putative MFS transporter
VVGLGLGAELPVASTLVSEYAPTRIRGRVVVLLEAFWAVGWVLAALIGYFVVPASDNGWRWALFIGIVPAAYALYVRAKLPESVRFLENRGRSAEAEEAVRTFESASSIAPVESPAAAPAPAARWSELWSDGLRGRTVALWAAWFGINFSYYGAFIWIPSLLVSQGFSLTKSFGFTLIITLAQLPGYAAAAFLIEAWGRRATLATFLAGSAISAYAFGQAGSETAIIAAGCALSFFNLGAWGALYAVTPEVYPTSLRGTGAGSAAAFGRIASIIAPLSVPWLLDLGGTGLVFTVFGVAFALAAAAALALPEWRGRALAP